MPEFDVYVTQQRSGWIRKVNASSKEAACRIVQSLLDDRADMLPRDTEEFDIHPHISNSLQ